MTNDQSTRGAAARGLEPWTLPSWVPVSSFFPGPARPLIGSRSGPRCLPARPTADARRWSEAVASCRTWPSIRKTSSWSSRWAPPSGSPADLPLPFTYVSNATNSTELGFHWSGPYHRFAENITTINPNPVNVNTPLYSYSYSNNGTSYANVLPNQNTLVGNSTTGWTETQPDGTSFNFDNTGVLRTVRNRAGVRWTLTWDSGFNHVQGIQAPFGRRTTFVYNASNLIMRIVDPGGRITTVTVNANTDLSRIISPELCTTTFVYNGSHQLCAWVNPLGDRTSFIYQSGSVFAVQQPLGQRSTYTSRAGGFFPPSPATTTFTNPRNALTTIQFQSTPALADVITDPFGNQTQNIPDRSGLTGQTQAQGPSRRAHVLHLPVAEQRRLPGLGHPEDRL